LAKRIEKEPKIGLQLGTLGGGNHFLEVVYSEGDGQALSLCLNLQYLDSWLYTGYGSRPFKKDGHGPDMDGLMEMTSHLRVHFS